MEWLWLAVVHLTVLVHLVVQVLEQQPQLEIHLLSLILALQHKVTLE
jgi:hypothetical protein